MKFVNISDVDESLQLDVRNWRNHTSIKRNMYTDETISIEQHQVWLNSLKEDKRNEVYIAYKSDEPIGIVSINHVNTLHRNADWAFYLNPKYLGVKGLGMLMEYHFLNYVFEKFDIEKLNCEVLSINSTVITLHLKFGFEVEGIRRKNIIKDGDRTDVHLLGILKGEWAETKGKFQKIIERLERK